VMFGNPETTTGGRALKFYSSIRVDIRRIQSIKEGDRVIGSRTRAKIVKNKVAAPFREAEFDIIYGEGISREGDLIDLGVAKNILEKSGTWISYKGERLGQGRDNARVFLRDNHEIREKVDHELRKALGLIASASTNGDKKPVVEPEKGGAVGVGAPKAAAAQAGRSSR
jgi:recombination protein RecA